MKSGRKKRHERGEPTNQIRLLLNREGKKTWAELLEKVKCSPSTLSKILKDMMASGEIICEIDPQDRRITRYSLKDTEKADVEVKRYLAIKFLESLKNPRVKEEVKKANNYKVTISLFVEGKELPSESFADFIPQMMASLCQFIGLDKTAIVITAEKEN